LRDDDLYGALGILRLRGRRPSSGACQAGQQKLFYAHRLSLSPGHSSKLMRERCHRSVSTSNA
jgi:hypothetical protein